YGPLCDHIIAVSNGVVNALTAGGVDPQKITCVHSVIEAKRYEKKGSEQKVRAELGLEEDTNVISIISQLIERKGHRFLFQAAPKILEQFPKTVFLVLGEGKAEASLRRLAASLGIEDKVIFTGFRNDVGEILSITTVLAHPATMEGFANCVLQAMAAGVPVVVTAVGGMPEAVRDGVNGILIPPRDPNAIADAVMKLLRDPELRCKMGAEGKRIAEGEFNVDTMVEGVLAVYRDVLKMDGKRLVASVS
ncbi:MAG: glycosyltransferase family 4 protein, partial [Armatimonadota bacterium]